MMKKKIKMESDEFHVFTCSRLLFTRQTFINNTPIYIHSLRRAFRSTVIYMRMHTHMQGKAKERKGMQ